MFSSENLLGLPKEKFGLAGIHLGNVISKELAKQDKGYKAQYNPISNKITVLNTSDLPSSVLNKMLYVSSASREYDTCRWYPIVKDERNKEGNLEINLSGLKPGVDHSRSHSSRMGSLIGSSIDFKERMFSSENLLGLPKEKFGLAGIHLGNVISKELAKQDKEYKAQYNPISNNITILNTSDLPSSVLNKMLYVSSTSREYDTWRWYPIVKDERNKEGNLEINFSGLKPGVDHSRMTSLIGSSIDFIDTPSISLQPMTFGTGLISGRSSIRSNSKFPSIDFEEEAIDKKEVVLMEKAISEGIINTMSQFLNKHEMTKGIWYPNDYRKYLMDEFDIEMDESFCTGFASEKFFEKTGCFTFELKEGKKASEALLSFLKGPTVADCGNATMACYYKCILDIVGNDKFDELFSSKPFKLTISRHGITDEKSPISYLSEYTKASSIKTVGILGKRPLKIGQECHFGGIIWYGNKHPEGFGSGWNVIYIGNNKKEEQLFMAHGFEKPLTENEINQKLVELYNRERTPQDDQHVIQAKKPQLYDKEKNKHLVSHYTISDGEVEKTPGKFIKGFLVSSIRGLKVDELIKLKNAKDIYKFKLKLITKKASSLSELFF